MRDTTMNSNYPFVNDTHNRYWYSIFAELVGEEGSGEYLACITALRKTKEKFPDAEMK